eukprot:CAMPEP_0197599758 /NCGR_PEP_ID=MMETSP1326-20131121/32027_1 /TAXON_ID=1155430 /ORGANISM="Genus nov. species nov., Strain RCC2288" /LENGTH=152 /DNA_ID=CAMNT_0043166771 /DNA_START=65 /DNA_END=519 /DNA_ORIENTATION=+
MALMLRGSASRLRRLLDPSAAAGGAHRAVLQLTGGARGYASEREMPSGGIKPTFAGAYCEGLQVELGQAKAEVSIGFETGRLARLTDGAVVASMGDSRVICTAVMAREPDPSANFLPLVVEYRERTYAKGEIPRTYTKREGAPKDREVLAMR